MVDCDVVCHSQQPPPCRALGLVQDLWVLPGAEQRLLHHVLGVSPVAAGQAERVRPQGAGMLVMKRPHQVRLSSHHDCIMLSPGSGEHVGSASYTCSYGGGGGTVQRPSRRVTAPTATRLAPLPRRAGKQGDAAVGPQVSRDSGVVITSRARGGGGPSWR